MKPFALSFILLSLSLTNLNAQSWQNMRNNMLSEFQNGNYTKAIEYGEQAREAIEGNNEFVADYASVMSNLAFLYLETGQLEIAESYYLEVLEIILPVLGEKHQITARTRTNLAEVYMKMYRPAMAEEQLLTAFKNRKLLFEPSHPEYTQSLRYLANLGELTQNIPSALAYHDTICEICLTAQDTAAWLSALNNRALMLHRNARNNAANEAYNELLNEDLKYKHQRDEESLIFLRNAGLSYRASGEYQRALELYQLLADESMRIYGKSPDLASVWNETGILLYEAGEMKKALEYYKQAEKLLSDLGLQNAEEYIELLNNFGVLYYVTGKFADAEKYYLKAADLIKANFSETHLLMAENYNSRAVLYSEGGNYKRAEELYLLAIDIFTLHNDFESDAYFALLINFADLHEKTNDYEKAEQYYLEAWRIAQKIYGTESFERMKLNYRIAGFFKDAGKYRLADSLYADVTERQRSILGEMHPDYAVSLNNWGSLKISLEEYDAAETLLKEASEIKAALFGEDHPEYAVSLNNLAALYYSKGDMRKSKKYFRRANESLNRQINESFAVSGSEQIEAFLQTTNYLYDVYNSFYFIRAADHPKEAGRLFENLLYRKSMLSEYERTRRIKVLQNSKSHTAEVFEDYLHYKQLIGKLILKNSDEHADSIRHLRELADKTEQIIRNNSPAYNRLNDKIYDYRELKKYLNPDEALVEFVRFRFYNIMPTDQYFYCALLLHPEEKYPIVIKLFEEQALAGLLEKDENTHEHEQIARLYHRKTIDRYGFKTDSDSISLRLYQLIWKPLEPYLKDIKRVRYSPDGLLHKVAFSAIADEENRYLSDRFELRLMSNTNSIAEENADPPAYKTAVLYGNIDYDASPNDVAEEASKYRHEDSDYRFSGKLFGDIRHDSWQVLYGTKEEIARISKSLEESDTQITIYEENKAVEESIRQFSGTHKGPDILHIATHGFFFAENEKAQNNQFGMNKDNRYLRASGPMFRSGLLFAGANRSWNNLEMPEFADDGIFTAYEAALLNLTETDLVVLSACETGLGDIQRYEGVYGLQRAFKIAGSDKIIMSLWKVPDAQTVELMEYFYTFLTKDFTADEAFREAVNIMKKRYLPYYWAAFVLLE